MDGREEEPEEGKCQVVLAHLPNGSMSRESRWSRWVEAGVGVRADVSRDGGWPGECG